MGHKIITPPATEPVTAAQVKTYLNISTSDDDTLIGLLITSVRQYAEMYLRRALITQTQELVLDAFPDGGIELPNPPLSSVSSVTYIDTNGDSTVLAASGYAVDVDSQPGWVVPAYGEVWPETRDQINAVRVRYICGWDDAASIPEAIKTWIKARIGAIYEQREGMVVSGGTTDLTVVPHQFLDGLLDPYRFIKV